MRPPGHYEEDGENNNGPNMGAMMICTRLAGRAIIRVVGRCNEAQENNNLVMASGVTRVIHRCEEAQENLNLNLSECQLMQVPDAVYHLMRHTELKSCDLSGNVITKIPPKFALNFSLITDLNLSHNQMSKLPDEIADLGSLQRLDISHNAYIALPDAIFRIPKLERLNASNNYIVDVEIERLEAAPSLEQVDLTNNPLRPRCHDRLGQVTRVRVNISPRETEDWEDLTV